MMALMDMGRELALTEDQINGFMSDIKQFMMGLIMEIMQEMGMGPDQIEMAAADLQRALETLSTEEYFMTMSYAFSGQDMGGMGDLITMDFEMPDM